MKCRTEARIRLRSRISMPPCRAKINDMSQRRRTRGDYVDNDRIYYGYDNGRVYQIDRQSQMVLALLDIVRR